MAVLNAWQKITRVVSGKPFGNGTDGAYSSATIPTMTKDSCSGSATSTTLTTSGSTFANNDILLIHQSRGTGVGQWEVNKVASGGGSASLTLSNALQYTYTDSGASQAQAIKIPQYTDVTVQSGTWTLSDWDGNTGGILVFAANGTVTVTGTISATGKGYVLGAGGSASGGSTATQGEGAAGTATQSTSANGNGGGGSLETTCGNGNYQGGGGGGNGAAGETGGGSGSAGETAGTGGSADGSADLTDMVFGGGGGGNAVCSVTSTGNGGDGGGIVIIFSKAITINGGIANNGNTGTNAMDGATALSGGGGGAGGSVLVACATATLGTNLITASGGSRTTQTGNESHYGGAGGVGRIAIHHSGAITGSTSPALTDVTDSNLVESSGGGKVIFF